MRLLLTVVFLFTLSCKPRTGRSVLYSETTENEIKVNFDIPIETRDDPSMLAAMFPNGTCPNLYFSMFEKLPEPPRSVNMQTNVQSVFVTARNKVLSNQVPLSQMVQEVKALYKDTIIASIRGSNPRMAETWSFWVENTELDESPSNEGAMLEPAYFGADRMGIERMGLTAIGVDYLFRDQQVWYMNKETWDSLPNGKTNPKIQLPDQRRSEKSEYSFVQSISHELTHNVNWAPASVVQKLTDPASYGAYLPPEIAKKAGEGGGAGFGEEYTWGFTFGLYLTFESKQSSLSKTDFEQLVTSEVAGTNRTFEGVDRYSQMGEAIADEYGIINTVAYIKKKFPTDRQAQKIAAQSVLAAWPPSLYHPCIGKVINRLGAKKLNENRVLNIFLQNQDFEAMLACEPVKPVLLQACKEVLVNGT